MGNFCVQTSDERKEGTQTYKDQTNELVEKERLESQNTPRAIENSNVVIPKLADSDMLEIGDNGELAAVKHSPRGVKGSSGEKVATPETKTSNESGSS